MIRIAATGDIHYDKNSLNRLGQHLIGLDEKADFLLLAGDLTQTGHPEEMRTLAEDLKKCPIPIIAVLGNHDYHFNEVKLAINILSDSGVIILEGTSITINVNQKKVGIAGLKGFGGGFVGACGSEFGEEEMKAFIRHSKQERDI
jgi:Icc-related predicted phosphoesterase